MHKLHNIQYIIILMLMSGTMMGMLLITVAGRTQRKHTHIAIHCENCDTNI